MIRKVVGVLEAETMPLAPSVAAELIKISRTLTFMSRSLNKSRSLWIGATQGRILAYLLSRSPAHVTLSDLAKGAAVSPATASEAVRRLKERGLVRKVRSRDDARVIHLSLSAVGRRKAEHAATGNNHVNAAIRRLNRRQQELILRALKNIQQAVDLRVKKP